ncbi:MAG: hypothetical protein OEM77_01100 [Nitrosopumilus sp.]|nr:hypothetical protein [Nitrosopumilus sp.]MDH3735751.1 hypothetical protein [Nitrosopumilus sp.]MDH3824076.1 hypothetical protein [Nitrosopumilus sp.]MDH3833226.1 hypothetical protein [Nitrosopumilus sp.]
MEESIDYQESSTMPSAQEPETIPIENREIVSSNPITELNSSFTTLKSVIPNFPSLDKSPQHYIDRYNNEPKYHSWFDSQFPFYSIDDVVGYKLTSVDGFPSLDKSPQHYIDRYNNEPKYHSWFDSKFPDISIYNILGYKDPISVPEWIRNNAGWWATGEITDSTFATGIEFILENDIIVISDVPSGNVLGDEIPVWIRNNALWWSQNLISEDEFVNSEISYSRRNYCN